MRNRNDSGNLSELSKIIVEPRVLKHLHDGFTNRKQDTADLDIRFVQLEDVVINDFLMMQHTEQIFYFVENATSLFRASAILSQESHDLLK